MIASFGAAITLAVVAVVTAGLVFTRIGADLILLSGLTALLAAGVLGPAEAIAGFANPAVVTVALLYVVAAGLRETGALEELTTRVLGQGSMRSALTRMLAPIAVASAFVSNTPIVAMLMPALTGWARRRRWSPAPLLMPLSFATILGGMCSLIGTSTNLVVNALLIEHIDAGHGGVEPMGMFTLAWVGVPATIVGLTYLTLVAPRWLPNRETRTIVDDSQEYSTAMLVTSAAAVVGRTIEEAGLRHLPGLYLSRIERSSETVVAAGSTEVLRAQDVLVFVGVIDSVVDLRRIRGLEPIADGSDAPAVSGRQRPSLLEVVVAPGARFIGETVRDAEFRTRYGAAIVAVSRRGERIEGKIGDIRLRPGDMLLLEAQPEFIARIRGSRDFYLASLVAEASAPRHSLAWLARSILVAMVVLIALQPAHAMTFALAAALAMVLFRCCSSGEARGAVDLQVLLVIGAAFGIATALEKTGVAGAVAGVMVDWAAPWGLPGLLAATFVATSLLTQVITNNAAAILMFPVAFAAAHDQNLPFMPFALCLATAASAGFATPIAYQTNLMVMGPGSYQTRDFLRVGVPLTILVGFVAVAVLTLLFSP